jgi:hypothetical protein
MPGSPDGAPGIEEYCWSVVSSEEDGPHRFAVNRGGYVLFSQQYRLRFFEMMADLYGHLAMLHRTRVEVATKWLQDRNLLEPPPARILRPHTQEWFEALGLWNPAQAAYTRAVIEATGNSNVCSICADDPAKDYKLDEGYSPPAGVDTFRLCDDCLRIRRAGGEPFVALSDD